MAGKNRYLHYKRGRYSARLVVPAALRPHLGNRTELTKALGADRREALKALPATVALLQAEIADAERRATGRTATRYPMSPAEIAVASYRDRLAQDEEARAAGPAWAQIDVDLDHVAMLRAGTAGKLTDGALYDLVGHRIENFRRIGNTGVEFGSPQWRELARILCISELEALQRVVERDEGDFTGKAQSPVLAAADVPEDNQTFVSLRGLWADYIKARQTAGKLRDGGKRIQPVLESLRDHLRHDDATRITKKDLLDWRDKLLERLNPRTVSAIYVATVRSVLKWSRENDRLLSNEAENVKQVRPKLRRTREAGYTDTEAVAVLKASRSFKPVPVGGKIQETAATIATRRWVPLLCAFTGARVGEMAQLRKEDVRQEGDRWVIRITFEAGAVKVGDFRDVPLHRQVIAEGFAEFVQAAPAGPLFSGAAASDPTSVALKRAVSQAARLGTWLRRLGLVPDGVQPNHGWRHRFKTQARDLGLDSRVADAIQGHAGKSAADDYGDVSLIAKARVIDALPDYQLT